MDYVTASSMEWMEMDARTIHFHAVDTWTVDVEWIASLHSSNLGGGRPDAIKGRRTVDQYQLRDIFVAIRDGPVAWAGAGEFAAALNYLDSTISGLLKCSGFFYSPAPTPSFGHMYILPGEKQGSRSVTSFKDLLHERDARGKRKRLLFSLNQRLEFAKRLATAVLFVHAIGWVHKSIMSQNVLILGRNGRDPRMPGEEKKSQSTKWSLNSPYLVGFEIARSNEAETIPGASVRLPLAISVYKHPELQDDTHVRFDMAHDVYSLGVVLLELGIWSPLEERPELQGISEPRDIAKALFRVANEVEILMGKRYREIVQTCLSQEAEARTGSIKLISEVLEKLEDLAQGV
ncbi:hypothetical protein Forpi1262_v014434 [Fusarium oxysporum f. sp. raphani]|uniref:Protein kinase domain-containing protein n=1 Tax=Fusarium oxysporum f. sp. raphani TaxID=96318 RepID=A0A8J5U8E2_FUSOX|nr:hypothetical protein Forpi1262_v014434 [Fusarium oxysporum f. sp. raphani]